MSEDDILLLAELATDLDLSGERKSADRIDKILNKISNQNINSTINNLSEIHSMSYEVKDYLRSNNKVSTEIMDEVSSVLEDLEEIKNKLRSK